jgi:hypothetical protein
MSTDWQADKRDDFNRDYTGNESVASTLMVVFSVRKARDFYYQRSI